MQTSKKGRLSRKSELRSPVEDGYYCQNLNPCWGGWWQEAGDTGMKHTGEGRKLRVCVREGPGQLPGRGCQQREHPGKAALPEDWAEGSGWQDIYRDFVSMCKKGPSFPGAMAYPCLHPVLQRGSQGPNPAEVPQSTVFNQVQVT